MVPPLSAGMSPGRCTRETLMQRLLVFPSGKVLIESTPFDQHLRNDSLTALVKSCLQNALWNLKHVFRVGKNFTEQRR